MNNKKKYHILGNDQRTILMRKNIIANFFIKGCSGAIILALVPLTLKCLGAYTNGVWQTISAALILIDNLDIGLGNGLRNKVTEYAAKEDWDKVRTAISTTIFLLILIIIPIMVFLLILINSINLYEFLNISTIAIPNLKEVTSISIILFCSTFIMKFIGNIYLGFQLPAISNFLATAGQPITLVCTYAMYYFHINSIMLIAIANLAAPLLVYCLAYPYTFYKKYPKLSPSKKFISKSMARGLFSMGIMFFLNQISSTIVLLSSNVVISRWFEPAMVTPYQISYKYFSIPFIIFTVINAPIWSATTDAYQKGDKQWIRNSVKRMNKTLLFFFLIMVVLVCISKYIYAIWVGEEIHISQILTISVALYIYMMMLSLVYCYYLNGIGALKLQLVCTLTGVVIYMICANILHHYYDNIVCVTLAMALSLVPNIVCNKIQFTKIINGTAKGIWTK